MVIEPGLVFSFGIQKIKYKRLTDSRNHLGKTFPYFHAYIVILYLQLAMIIQIDTLQINQFLIKGLQFLGIKTQDNKYYVYPGQK